MGCCLSKKTSQSSSSPDLNKSAIDKPPKPKTESLQLEESKLRSEVELQDNNKPRKKVFVIKHRRSHERCKTTTDPEDSTASDEKSTGSNQNPVDVDAILIQCGRLSRSNSATAKTRRYSGSKRSFDFDQNERSHDGGDADGEEEEAERRIHRHRPRGGDSPRERRRRTPSREREDWKSYRSGSRERGSGSGSGSRRVSRSPGRRSETNPNPNSCAGSGSSVNSSNNNRPARFVSVPATDKASLVMEKSNNVEPSVKRITVKRNVASPRSQSPARAASPRSKSPARAAGSITSNAQPSPSKLRRKTEHSPYRRNPLGEIDPNSLAYRQGDRLGSGNTKKVMNRDNESQRMVKESANLVGQKMNAKTATPVPIQRSKSPSRVTKEQQEAVEKCKIVLSSAGTEMPKPQIVSWSRSLRKSRDFDFSPEALLSNNIDNNNNNNVVAPAGAAPSYAALLLEDIQNFHQKSVNVNVNVNAVSASISKACSIIEEVSDLNSTTDKHQKTELNNFTSTAMKKADLMEPRFKKYVTVKRGASLLEDMEEQESSGSNSITGSSCVVQRHGYSTSSSREPDSAELTDRMSRRSSNKERYRSPLSVQEFDPLRVDTTT